MSSGRASDTILQRVLPLFPSFSAPSGAASCLEDDPYLDSETDPALCHAMESYLWEVASLQNHYIPRIAKMAKTLLTPPITGLEQVGKIYNSGRLSLLCSSTRRFHEYYHCLLIHPFLPSFLLLFTPSFLPSFSSFLLYFPPFLPSFPSCLPACLPSFFPSFLPPFLRSFLLSPLSFLPSFLHCFLPSSFPYFVPPFLRSSFPSFLPLFPSFFPP